jgi:hypothetical protein
MALIAILLAAVSPLITAPSPAEAADSWVTLPSGTTEDLKSVWGSSCNDVFAVGMNGTILHYNGNTWTAMNSGTSMGLNGIWGSSANNVFAVGWSGTILHYNGTSWSTMTNNVSTDLSGVWGNAPNSVFAVGAMQTLLHWDGNTWTPITTPALEANFAAVWGTAYNNVYIVGSQGDIYHFDGTSLTQMTSNTGNDLLCIWGGAANDIWAAGILQSSKVHYNGTSWTGGGMPNLEYYRGLWGTSTSNVYLAGNAMMGAGFIDRYNGSSWLGVTIPPCGHLNGIWGSGSNDIFAIGNGGAILHTGGCGGATSASVSTTLGTVNLNIDAGSISNAAWVPTSNIRCSNPSGYNFPFGMFSFNIGNLTPGQTARVTLKFPTPLPLGIKYYKCINGAMVDCTSLMTRVNEYTLVLALTDGGKGDADGIANGSITDPGGPAVQINVPPSSSAGGTAAPASQKPVTLSNISVKSASLSATKVAPGDPVTVTASVANTGTGNGASMVKVYVNGAEESSQGVTVNSGGASSVSFTLSRNEPGTYSVYVGGTQAGSFTVDEFTPNTVLYISGALVFFALVIAVIYMTRRRA